MDETPPLQLILPTDKRNPCFSLYLDREEKQIHVYYGLELLEVVPNDPEHSAYKLLVGRLYRPASPLPQRGLRNLATLTGAIMRACFGLQVDWEDCPER